MKENIINFLEDEFGKWFDSEGDLILTTIPKQCKMFLLLCGSSVEGFVGEGSDLDFTLVIEDRLKTFNRKRLQQAYEVFHSQLEEKAKQQLRIDHLCGISKNIWTITWLMQFKKCRNPQFRMNYFEFGKPLYPNVTEPDMQERLATPQEYKRFKKELLDNYRRRYGFAPLNVKDRIRHVLNLSPKTLYREIQQAINNFLLTYGLIDDKILSNMDAELLEKGLQIVRSTLSRDAQSMIKPKVKSGFDILRRAKDEKKRSASLNWKRIKYMRDNSYLTQNDVDTIQTMATYFLDYVYHPVNQFKGIQNKLAEWIGNEKIKWLGVRADHVYIALHNMNALRCLDVLKEENGKYGIYAIFERNKSKQLATNGLPTKIEVRRTFGPLNLPCKVHIDRLKKNRRLHFKVMEIAQQDINEEQTKTRFNSALSALTT